MHNDNESCLLNILLTSPEKQSYIFENTDISFFEDGYNRNVFRIAEKYYKKNGIVSNVDIVEENPALNKTVTDLLLIPVAFNSMVTTYCKKLYEKRLNHLVSQAKTEEDLEAVKDFKQQYGSLDYRIRHISDEVDNFENEYKENAKNSITTGYNSFDEKIGSFMPGDYIALGGTTGMGKTAIALNLANMLSLQDKKVLYFSLEMPFKQIQNRFACMIMGLNAHKYRSYGFSVEELEKYKIALKSLKEWNLNVVCDFNISCEKMKNYIINQKKQGLDFVILDYLGLMSGFGNKSLYEKMSNLSRQVKLIAVEQEVPILVLVQLNRDLNKRQEKRPVLSDIRESGAIEQDADFVLFAYRDFLYNPEADKTDLELIIAKNRHGESNSISKLKFDLSTQLISERW